MTIIATMRRALLLCLACIGPAVLAGCSTARVDERMAYWKIETDAHLKVGTTRGQAEEFFAARNATLKCCTRQRPGPDQYFVHERKVGHALWTEYDVAVLVEFSPAGEVSAVRIERWGVGF
ncbi:MAG: hypothetical protein WCV99_16330 [Sterolibacterium sp.]|jgi:hypothetical protein